MFIDIPSIKFRPYFYYLTHTVSRAVVGGVITEYERMLEWLVTQNLQENIDFQFSETCAELFRQHQYADREIVPVPTNIRFADRETELVFRIKFGCVPGSGCI